MQTNKLHFLILLFLVFTGQLAFGQEDQVVPLPIKRIQDTISAPLPPISIRTDSIVVDSADTAPVTTKKQLLLGEIKYKAKDYVKLSQKDQKIYLYDEAEIYYQDTELKAGVIVMDYVKNEVYSALTFSSKGEMDRELEFHNSINDSLNTLNEKLKGSLSIQTLTSKGQNIKKKLYDSLSKNSWKTNFNGRMVLQKFVNNHCSGLRYERFRNLVISKMSSENYKPDGMKVIIDQIVDQ